LLFVLRSIHKAQRQCDHHIEFWEVKSGAKGNAIPLQAWTDPEGSRSLRLPDFKIIGT